MSAVEGPFPQSRMEVVENAVGKRLEENEDYQAIQRRLDDMLETIGQTEEKRSFAFDLEEAIGLKECHEQWEYYRQGILDGAALLKWMGLFA